MKRFVMTTVLLLACSTVHIQSCEEAKNAKLLKKESPSYVYYSCRDLDSIVNCTYFKKGPQAGRCACDKWFSPGQMYFLLTVHNPEKEFNRLADLYKKQQEQQKK